MKLKYLLYGCVLAGLMTACNNDLPGEEGGVLENETTTYVRVSLINAGDTRAAEYENGSADESMIKEILLTFFDAGRNYVGRTLVTVNEDNTIQVPGSTNNTTVERVLTVVAPVTLPEHINYPKYVVAYVNPTSQHHDLATDKLEDAMGITRSRSTISFNGYRTMNNSAYFSNETGYIHYATEVDFQNQFFETMEEAQNATTAAIEITVERVEAKVRFSSDLANISQEDYTGGSSTDADQEYTLHFTPQAWFVNATEKRSFLLKNYRSNRINFLTGNYTDVDYGMKLSDLKQAFKVNNTVRPGDKRYDEVNDAAKKRSYWAIDPTYFTSDDDLYPDVSYDAQYGEINPTGNVYPLLYRSYADVMEEQNKGKSTNYVKFNSGVKTHEYVLENTMSRQTLEEGDAMASMSSVVLIGYYTIKNKAGNVVFDGSTDKPQAFYVRHEADKKKYIMVSDNEAKDFFLERGGSTLYVQTIDKDGNPVKGSYEPLRAAHLKDSIYGVSYNDFELIYPSKDLAGKKLSEQWRTMQLKKNGGVYNTKIYVYDATMNDGNGGYKNITDADIASLNTRLYSIYGVLEKFQTGKAYFNVPLKHIWGVGSTDNSFDASKVILGDYGVVRNHVYDLTVNSIKGLGTGIGDIDQPIVPPTVNDQYYINTKLRILQWRLVKQSVDL